MLCENIFCIYQNNDSCILDHAELDIMGQCKNCIYISIPDNELHQLKKKTLKSLEQG